MLYAFLPDPSETENFEELALGGETVSYFASVDGVPVHCHDLDDAHRCLRGYRDRGGARDVVLWLGNSQVHSINQMKPGDETAAADLHRRVARHGRYFLTFSQPNANLQEHYLLFQYLLDRVSIKTLVLPVVFDDMRNTGIRNSLADALKAPAVAARLAKTAIGQRLLSDHGDQDAAGNDMAALDDTVQEKSEAWLNARLESLWPLWAQRPTLRGELFLFLYQFRNWALGINPSSIRRMIPGRYALNRQALEATLDLARGRGIHVLLYVVPIRDDVKIPYDLNEYRLFKDDMKRLALAKGARFANLENLVPAQYRGSKAATTVGGGNELDFMHFQAGGHALLAEALYTELQALGWGEGGRDF